MLFCLVPASLLGEPGKAWKGRESEKSEPEWASPLDMRKTVALRAALGADVFAVVVVIVVGITVRGALSGIEA